MKKVLTLIMLALGFGLVAENVEARGHGDRNYRDGYRDGRRDGHHGDRARARREAARREAWRRERARREAERRRRHRRHHRHNDFDAGDALAGAAIGFVVGNAAADCSPDVRKKNVVEIENLIQKNLDSELFANSEVLSGEFESIKAFDSADFRIGEYMMLLGIDFNDKTAIVNFLGARNHTPYVQKAQESLNLSEAQAKKLVKDISKAMLSKINR